MSRQPGGKAEWIRGVLTQHEPALLRYALRLTGDPQAAQDVVQETFLRLCQADRAQVDGHVGPWLFRVCRQRVLDLHRKEQRMPTVESGVVNGYASLAAGPDQQCQTSDDARAVLAVLATLSADQQEVVRLKFNDGLSYRDISEITGHTISNVGVLLHTAIKNIRESLNTSDPIRCATAGLPSSDSTRCTTAGVPISDPPKCATAGSPSSASPKPNGDK